MSTGERRRVLLARAMVSKPRALILYEPTSGLDLVARIQFLKLIEQLSQLGTQIVLVTHHMEEIFPGMSRTILMKQGQVLIDEPTAEAISSTKISELFDHSIEVARSPNGWFLVTGLVLGC